MPSLYQEWCRDDPYDARMKNLAKARISPRWAPPRPFRSKEESHMIRRFVWQWLTCRDRSRPSGRAWARALCISHVWLQKLVRAFTEDPNEMQLEAQRYGDPTFAQLSRAREDSRRMRDCGQLRSPRKRVSPAIEPAMEQFVKERFAQGWSKARLVRELFLDRRTVKRILRRC